MFALNSAHLALGRTIGQAALKVRAHSPLILTVVGGVSILAAAVLTVKATLKVEETINEHDEAIETLKNHHQLALVPDEEFKKQLTVATAKKWLSVAKLYAAPATLIVGGIGCMAGSSFILNRRNVAVAAAYTAIKEQYDNYRQNVRDTEGVEKDREYLYGTQKVKVVDPETGKTVTKTITDPTKYSRYAKFFDEGNINFNKNWREGNLMFLVGKQKWANEHLHSWGYLTLNDVYKSIGLTPTPDGAVVGWTLARGDDFVDFGIFDLDSPAARDFVNGHEPNILLDFNVAGLIQGDIGKPLTELKHG